MGFLHTFNPIFYIFLSYTIGALTTVLIRRIGYFESFENHNHISDTLTKKLGVPLLGKVIRNSILGKFNENIRLEGGFDIEKLEELKRQMSYAENGHLFAFIYLQIFVFIIAFLGVESWQILGYTLTNIVLNLYLVFLQQYNKRRIDRILRSAD